MTKTWLEDLNSKQQKAVCFGNGPLLILAGAGSGKTRTLTYRAAYLITEMAISPDQILLLTFTNKAAGEMKQRIKKLINHQSPFAGTFHSFCVQILKAQGQQIGLSSNFAIFDQNDQLQVVKKAIDKLNLSTKEFKAKSVLYTISGAKNELINASEYSGYARGHWQKNVAQIYFTYQRLLSLYNGLDFDDLLTKTVELFKKVPEVLGYYQNKYQHVLVDEYQDTNKAQYVLTKLLSGRWHNLTVVGDASQSIYMWRGADFRNILNLKSDFPNLTTINLEKNYRSTQNILEAAYQVISQNTSHPILKLWTENQTGSKLTIFETRDEHREAEMVAEKILQLKNNFELNDMAVLYRTNAQSRVLEEVFLKYGLAYRLVGGTRFYERKEIKDCLAYLRYLQNQADEVSLKRLEKLGKRRLEQFLKLVKDLKPRLDNLNTKEILEQILKKSGYLELYDKKNEEDLTRLENINELKSLAQDFPRLDEFLIQVALVEQNHLATGDQLDKDNKQAVSLMTMHAAKGLEFANVFIVGMEEGLFPHSRSLLEKDELEEERRLCYVGITRAKQNLFLSYAQRRLFFGQRSANQVSRFVADIPPGLLKIQR